MKFIPNAPPHPHPNPIMRLPVETVFELQGVTSCKYDRKDSEL